MSPLNGLISVLPYFLRYITETRRTYEPLWHMSVVPILTLQRNFGSATHLFLGLKYNRITIYQYRFLIIYELQKNRQSIIHFQEVSASIFFHTYSFQKSCRNPKPGFLPHSRHVRKFFRIYALLVMTTKIVAVIPSKIIMVVFKKPSFSLINEVQLNHPKRPIMTAGEILRSGLIP